MLNTQYPHLKFTIEKATESLSFLDVEIKIFNNGFEPSVYRKQSNIGLVLNYPEIWLKMCLLHRAKLICSNVTLFNNEVKNLQKFFEK